MPLIQLYAATNVRLVYFYTVTVSIWMRIIGFCLRIIGNYFWNNQLLMENNRNRIMGKILSLIGTSLMVGHTHKDINALF